MMQSVNVKAKTETDTKHAITDNDCDPLFERKIQNATEGLNHDCFNWLKRDGPSRGSLMVYCGENLVFWR